MKEVLKRIIKFLIILLILIIVFAIVYLIINGKNVNKSDYSLDSANIGNNIQLNITKEKKLIYENNCNTYYTILSIITRYIDAASLGDTETLMYMFDKEYINKYSINESNLLSKIGIEEIESDFEYYEVEIIDMFSLDTENVTVHFIYGDYYNIADMEKRELNLMIELDNVNETFNLYNYRYMQDKGYNNLKVGDLIDISIDKIENRKNNEFKYIKVSEEDMAKNYLNNYKNQLMYNREKAYEMLDKEYSKMKFKDKDEFNQYVENKKIDYFTASLKEYKVETLEKGMKKYICKDQNENYYYFIETDGILRYTAILDNYVIPSEEFIEQYNKMNEQEKVVTNIKKFIMGINDKSYYYVYNNLVNEFKDNYFKSLNDFENYVRENFFENNEIEYENFEEQNGVYIYTIKIHNADNEEESIEKTIVMKLNEGTDFEMSFNVN